MKTLRNRIQASRHRSSRRPGTARAERSRPRAAQRAALAALYEEIGFARSLLAYSWPMAASS